MIDSRTHARPAWLDTLIFATATAGLLVAATFVMFSAFMFYDDEGYVLLSLRNFSEHGGLYRDVYSQYGPFPFVFYHALQVLGIPLTHTVGRLITIGAWIGAAMACALLVGRATRSLGAKLAVLVGVFLYLWIMASEPTHPGGIIVLLTTLLAAVGYTWIATEKISSWAFLVGAGAAALLLTKVNVGVFVAFSACAWFLLHHRSDALRRWAPLIVGAWTILLPLVLMRPLLGTPWVQTYALVFATSGIGVAIASISGATDRVDWRQLGMGLLAAGAVIAAVLGVLVLRGSQPRDLLEGLILGPLRQPTNFSLRYLWPPGIGIITVISLAGCAAAFALRKRNRAAIDVTIATLRIVAALGLAINILRFPAVSVDYLVFGSALPCLWLFVWSLSGEDSARAGARTWIALLLLGQCLHVFPVPGSQIAWGSVLTLPLAAIGAWDAATWLRRHGAEKWYAAPAIRRMAFAAVFSFFAITSWKFVQLATRYREGQNLKLPGAEVIRVPDDSAAVLRLLAQNAAAHADMLFSLPGMFSFNVWTGLPTPTHANVTHWFSLLDATRQQAIMSALEAHPRACVIIHREHVNYLKGRGLAPKGPLFDYIAQHFEAAFEIDSFEFCVRRGRRIHPFMVAEQLTRAGETDGINSENTLIRFALPLPPGQPVSSLELKASEHAKSLVLKAGNARVEISPANSRGEPIGPPVSTAWPLTFSGPAIVSFFCDRENPSTPIGHATLILRGATGDEVGLARLQP